MFAPSGITSGSPAYTVMDCDDLGCHVSKKKNKRQTGTANRQANRVSVGVPTLGGSKQSLVQF